MAHLSTLVLLASLLGQASSSTTPVPRNDAWWTTRHAQCVERTKSGPADVAFLGDSITQGWESSGKEAWAREIAPLGAANFGFGGDRTQHVLWRLANGELIGCNPKVVVLMIGTNNMGGDTPEQVAEGVQAIVKKLTTELPKTKVLLLAIFPRAESPDDPIRARIARANKLIAPLHDGKRVFFEDIGPHFVRVDGTLRTLLMPDKLHLNGNGYDIWAKAIQPTLRRLLLAPR